jgi:hypothetical protein
VEDYLRAAIDRAPELVGVDGSFSISTVIYGNPMTLASSDRNAWDADQVEYDTESGACLDALRHGRRSITADLTTENRWPAWAAAAVKLGFRSAAAVPAAAKPDDHPIALNMYSPTPAAFSAEPLQRAASFVEQVAQTLPLVLLIFKQARTITDLESAMASRSTIDQALGVVMAQNRCSRDEAFAILRRASQNGNVKLRDLAADILARYTGHPAAASPIFNQRSSRPLKSTMPAGEPPGVS